MSKYCPELNRDVLYMECLECDSKSCKSKPSNIQKSIHNKHNYIKENPDIFKPVTKETYNTFKEDLCKDKEYLDLLFENKNYNKLESELAERMSKLSYMITKANHDENKAIIIGQYAEYISSMRNRLTDIFLTKRFTDYINSCSISEIIIICKLIVKAAQENYSPDVISRDNPLEKDKFHIIDKLKDFGVITFVRPGAYRYLYLTQFGKECYEKNKVIVNYFGS